MCGCVDVGVGACGRGWRRWRTDAATGSGAADALGGAVARARLAGPVVCVSGALANGWWRV